MVWVRASKLWRARLGVAREGRWFEAFQRYNERSQFWSHLECIAQYWGCVDGWKDLDSIGFRTFAEIPTPRVAVVEAHLLAATTASASATSRDPSSVTIAKPTHEVQAQQCGSQTTTPRLHQQVAHVQRIHIQLSPTAPCGPLLLAPPNLLRNSMA